MCGKYIDQVRERLKEYFINQRRRDIVTVDEFLEFTNGYKKRMVISYEWYLKKILQVLLEIMPGKLKVGWAPQNLFLDSRYLGRLELIL